MGNKLNMGGFASGPIPSVGMHLVGEEVDPN